MKHPIAMMLASGSNDVSAVLLFGIPAALVALGLISFIPASRGHWSAILLAAPSVLIGLMLTWGIVTDPRKDMMIPVLWIVFPAPLIMGVAASMLWAARRRSRRNWP